MPTTTFKLSAFLFPLIAALGCEAPAPSQRASEFALTDDGVLLRDVTVAPGPGEMVAVVDGGLVVGVLAGTIEAHDDGTFFRSEATTVWYEEVTGANGSVSLRVYPGGIDSLGAEDGATFEPQTVYVCDSKDGSGRKCFTNDPAWSKLCDCSMFAY